MLPEKEIPVWGGIAVMVGGLALLMTSRFVAGRHLYGRFVPVEAKCVDREVLEYEDPDSIGSFIKITYWAPRILCEFSYKGTACKVTPIIVKTIAFNSEEEANRFLDERIDRDGTCTLWINPDNPLHTVFHIKPKTGPYTV